jgi:hypothetical protein
MRMSVECTKRHIVGQSEQKGEYTGLELNPSEKSVGWDRVGTTEICIIDPSLSQPSFYCTTIF